MISNENLRIGVDLGGTKIEAIALDTSGQVLARPRIATPRHDYEACLTAIRDLVLGIESRLGRSGTVGIGIPGVISPRTGLVKNANSTWLNGKALDKDMAALLQREVRVANDANCFAVSEATDGAGAGAGLVFGVILGTGVGGGIAIDGVARTGRNAIGGEWGHIPLPWPKGGEIDGPNCYCGQKGCVEKWLSGPAAADEFKRVTGRDLTLPQIIEAAGDDSEAKAAIDRYLDRLARALAVVVNIIDPDVIVLGGGVSNLPVLYSELPRLLPRWCFSDGIDTPVRQSLHGDSSGVRGAAWLWG